MVSLTILIYAIVASLVAAIPAPSTLPGGGSSLPRTFELFVYQGSTQIGCVNGRGNFTSNLNWCLPFNAAADTDGSGYAGLSSLEACSATGVLDCFETTAPVDTHFYVSSFSLSRSCRADTLCRSSMENLPLETPTLVAHSRWTPFLLALTPLVFHWLLAAEGPSK